MCPACIENAAVVLAGAASTGGILAMCIGSSRTFFERVTSLCFKRQRRNDNGDQQGKPQ